ncbi:alpha/beta hydrolase family protein [Tahibacter soli]|uniref:Alpha/beta hydrolase n=1 Tax=Tahibacter soli TaxID=2983605 RepID=A0A9X3YR34_9GAMM|nr:alpha/beta hydrolase [Tahibacter soli]MDC8014821.1 alpha/beta hydrolase [Tahibacter soli]
MFVSRLEFVNKAALFVALAAASGTAAADACKPGVYRSGSGESVAISERPNTAETGEWRYTFLDGRYGGTKAGVVACADDAVTVTRDRKPAERWNAVPLRTTSTTFKSGDLTLAGQLIEPAGVDKPPLVVFVHGSERTPTVGGRSSYAYLFAAQGISVFVFDKRGTGASGGTYNQNFPKLADDVVAASIEAKRLAAGRYSRFGLFGGSQGGWVAPRAANDAKAQFVAVGFGLLIDPLEEDAEQVQSELRELGYGDDVLAKARRVTDATGAVMAAHFADGYVGLAQAKKQFAAEPWFGKIKGEFTGDVLALDEAALRKDGRAKFDDLDLDWRYDARGELAKVKAPQLWVVAGADREAPPVTTVERLQQLRKAGKPIEIVVFPRTDHGMYEFTQAADGTRDVTRVTDGYYRLLGDWIKGGMRPPYGAGRVLKAGEAIAPEK